MFYQQTWDLHSHYPLSYPLFLRFPSLLSIFIYSSNKFSVMATAFIQFARRNWAIFNHPHPAKTSDALRIGLLGASNIAWVENPDIPEHFWADLIRQTTGNYCACEITSRGYYCCSRCARREEGPGICEEAWHTDCSQIISRSTQRCQNLNLNLIWIPPRGVIRILNQIHKSRHVIT